jgi:hypothetical protein
MNTETKGHVMTMTQAIAEYDEAIDKLSNANVRVWRALEAIEKIALGAFGGRPPLRGDDPIQIVCGDRLVTIEPCDVRPAVKLEGVDFWTDRYSLPTTHHY